jgi:predicted nucleotidyltransferase
MQAKTIEQLLPKDAAARLFEFRDAVAQALPGAVADIVLFGSRARGDASPDSDYDVAVVLKDLSNREGRRLADAAWSTSCRGLCDRSNRPDGG